jgi:hypothetical protein
LLINAVILSEAKDLSVRPALKVPREANDAFGVIFGVAIEEAGAGRFAQSNRFPV